MSYKEHVVFLILLLIYQPLFVVNLKCVDVVMNYLEGETVLINFDETLINFTSKGIYSYNHEKFIESKTHKFDNYLIKSKELNILSKVLMKIKSQKYHCKSKYIIFLSNLSWIQEAFDLLWKNQAYKTVIISNESLYLLDYERFDCKNVIYTTTNCEKLYDIRFDLKNCLLKASWHNRPPFTVDVATSKGYSMNIINTISNKYNFKLQLHDVKDKYIKEYGVTYSLNNLRKDFEADLCHIYITSFPELSTSSILNVDITYYIITNSYISMLPKPSVLTEFEMFIHIFTPLEWFLILLTNLSIIIILIKTKNDVIKLIFTVFGLNLNVSAASNFYEGVKLLFAFMLPCYLVLGIYLQSSLNSFRTSPEYEKPIKSFLDIFKTRYPIKIRSFTSDFLKDRGLILPTRNYEIINESIDRVMNNFMKRRDYITEGQDMYLSLYPHLRGEYGTLKLQTFLAGFPVTYCLHVGEQIDFTLRQFHEHGFILKWVSDFQWFIIIRESFVNDSIANNDLERIKLEDILYSFWMLGFGLSLGIVVFIIEIIYKIFKKDK
ncbi:uncharacterized protein [Onthophagus taurus]|uniref:uncharacterized protein n=1 Tax=Onthophagus taurus TaxID=166361 RepID=UPI0039BE1ED4